MNTTEQKNKKVAKKIRFWGYVSTVLIPTRQEFIDNDVANKLWSSEQENELYITSARNELISFCKENNLSNLKPKEIMRRYCESIGRKEESSDNSGVITPTSS